MVAVIKEMERKIEELSLSIRQGSKNEHSCDSNSASFERNTATFQKTKDRDQLVQLLRNLSPGSRRFNEIQGALLSSGMIFFVDPFTEIKYSLIKPEERLLGGAPQTITTILDGVHVRAILQDPSIPQYSLHLISEILKDGKLPEDDRLYERGKIYIGLEKKSNNFTYDGRDNSGKKIRGILQIKAEWALTQGLLDDKKSEILDALEKNNIIISRKFDRNENTNSGWGEDWKVLKPYGRRAYQFFYGQGQRTLVDLTKLTKQDKNRLKNRNTATIDRQNSDNTYSNISYQVGVKKDNNRYTYGMTFVDRRAGIFRFTTGWLVVTAIEKSLKDSYRYTVDVRVDYFDDGGWKICVDPDKKDNIIMACDLKSREHEKIENENIQYLGMSIHNAKNTYGISSLIDRIKEKIRKEIFSKNRTAIQEIDGAMPLNTIFLGIFCVLVNENNGDLIKACQDFENILEENIKQLFPMLGENILRVVKIDVLIKIFKGALSIEKPQLINEESEPGWQEDHEAIEYYRQIIAQKNKATTKSIQGSIFQPSFSTSSS